MNTQPQPELSRTALLLGNQALKHLNNARIAIIGLGAVGSYAAEALARSGVGFLRVIDFDVVKRSNVNRQLFALASTINRAKVDVAAERLIDINPALTVEPVREFAHAETLDALLAGRMDIIVDAVDSLAPKVEVILAGARMGIPVYSAMGAATRIDADKVKFGNIFKAKGCPLGRLVRKRLRKRGVTKGDLWCVYSDEERNLQALHNPDTDNHAQASSSTDSPDEEEEYKRGRERQILGSMATITGMFGLRLAHEVVLRLAGKNTE